MKFHPSINCFLLFVFLLGLNILAPAHPARAASLVVDTLIDENDGSCADGDCSLRDAIASAVDGNTISFSVTGTITLALGELVVDKSLTITGPGAGQLTLDGNNLSRIFNLPVDVPTNTVQISGLTMTKGYADPTVTCGGGAISNDAFLTLDDVAITNSSAPAGAPCFFPRGGAILVYNDKGSLTITDSTISGNSTYWDGGGIFFKSLEGTLSLTNVTLDDNHSTNAGGGAVYFYDGQGDVTISGSTISNNSGSAIGGALGGGLVFYPVNTTPNVTIENSVITLNSAQEGGGINSRRVALTIRNSTISGNTATTNGGGLMLTNNTTTIIGSTIEGNIVTGTNGNGGGIMNLGIGASSDLTLVNSTLTGNTADNGTGGGLKNQASGGGVTDVATTTIIN